MMMMGPEFAKVNGLWSSDAFRVYLRTSGKNFCAGDSEGIGADRIRLDIPVERASEGISFYGSRGHDGVSSFRAI